MKKFFFYLAIATYILAILPLPLTFLVDSTFHWLLIVTIPGGGILGSLFMIIWAVLKEPEKKDQPK